MSGSKHVEFLLDIRLLLHGKKVVGILVEMSAEMDRLHAVIIGLGLNINHRAMPAELKDVIRK